MGENRHGNLGTYGRDGNGDNPLLRRKIEAIGNPISIIVNRKRRCVERMHAFEQQVANYTLRKEAKGEDPTDGYEGYQKQVQGILTVGEEGEIVIEPKMREWLESIECTAEGDA